MPGPQRSDGSAAAAMAALHALRDQTELERAVVDHVLHLAPGIDAALCLADERPGAWRVHAACGRGRALPTGCVRVADWPGAPPVRVPIRFREHTIGELWLDRQLVGDAAARLDDLLVHYGTAVVNLTLDRESRQATDDYCASLQALEEGIVLFQEQEPAAVTARLLSLASSMAQATASALYVLEEAGNRASSLRLEQVFGMPESLLAQLRGVDGCAWPDVLLDAPVHLATRRGDPAAEGPAVPMGMLAPDCVPPLLQSLVVVPLRYHGVHSGVCLLFNPALDAARTGELLGRLQSFGQLGAALLHRLSLEALAANSRTFARELEIAEVIQGRLQPQGPPRTDEYDFAWSTIAAKSIGGDYLDVLMSDLGDVYVAVADASGHGVNSALLMSSFRANYRASAPWLEPEDLAAALNKEVVHEVGATGMFVTGALVRLERDTRRLAACSAGHNPMLLYRAATGRVDELASNGPPLGFVARPTFDATHDQLASGDVLVLYTDGLTEATDGAFEMFGEERLRAVLRDHAADGAAAVLAAIRQALVAFTGRDRQDDDVSVVVVKAR